MDDALLALPGMVFQRHVEAARERFAVKRFAQKTNGASSERLSAYSVIRIGGDENEGYVMPTRVQFVLQLQSTRTRHLHV